MSSRFIHSILSNDANISADGVVNYDLPVNPLSAILLNIEPLNETSTITNFGLIRRLLSALDLVEVLYKGMGIISMSGADLYALNHLYHQVPATFSNPVNTDNDRRSLVLPILLGRNAFDPNECFPKVRRGELQMQCTWDIADTGFDNLRVSVETIELPDADPKFFEQKTTLSQTFAATGDNDVDMPIGKVIRSILGFGTTGFAGANPAPTLGRLALYKDNLQTHYSASNFETSRAVAALLRRPRLDQDEHIHGGNFTTTVQGNTQFPQSLFPLMELYTLLDLDPTRDDMYSLETKGAGRVNLRVNAETADAARFIPVQKFDVADLPSREA